MFIAVVSDGGGGFCQSAEECLHPAVNIIFLGALCF